MSWRNKSARLSLGRSFMCGRFLMIGRGIDAGKPLIASQLIYAKQTSSSIVCCADMVRIICKLFFWDGKMCNKSIIT